MLHHKKNSLVQSLDFVEELGVWPRDAVPEDSINDVDDAVAGNSRRRHVDDGGIDIAAAPALKSKEEAI